MIYNNSTPSKRELSSSNGIKNVERESGEGTAIKLLEIVAPGTAYVELMFNVQNSIGRDKMKMGK